VALWRNWQTQQTQNLPGFTSRLGSTPSSATIFVPNRATCHGSGGKYGIVGNMLSMGYGEQAPHDAPPPTSSINKRRKFID
jgi:hypothetical protein